MPVFKATLFTSNHFYKDYLFNPLKFSNKFSSNENLILPLSHDSEWNDNAITDFKDNNEIGNRFHLSTQIKHIYNKPFCFFTDNAINETGNKELLPMKHEFIVCDYLEQLDIKSYIEEKQDDIKLPFIDIYLYSFFGIVDIPLIAKPNSLIYEEIITGIENNTIMHDKRVSVKWNHSYKCEIIFYISDINNKYHAYQLRLKFIDIGAIHGMQGYKSVCQNVGIDTTAKSLMDEYKTDMLTGLKKYPDEFIKYSNGDLNLYEILIANNDLLKTLYNDLDLSDYFLSPKLSIGSTVADIIASAIFKWQKIPASEYHSETNKKINRKAILKELMGLSSADYLSTKVINSNEYLLGKVQGGRCFNNNPLMRYNQDAIADYDIAGAYSSIMTQLPFFIGKPWLYNGYNENLSLKEFKRRHLHDFNKWHYVIYVSTNELLKHEQDLLVSWINFSKEDRRVKNVNGEYEKITLADYHSGNTRIFKNEIINCPITSDTIAYIDSLSKSVREELYNKLLVKSAIGYPNTSDKWDSINLGELLINPLKEKRNHYKNLYKETNNSVYNSLQLFYKLIINTTYGVMCSKYFITSNVVVANQITQAVRLTMYLMEKGLNLQGSITDGCMGSLNKVVYPTSNYNIPLNKLVCLYKYNKRELNRNLHIELKPLDNAEKITVSWVNDKPVLTVTYKDRIETINNVNEWINDKALSHLKMLFPKFNYLFDFFKIETKDVYESYVYHGQSNYALFSPIIKPKFSMRSYSKKDNAIGIEYNQTDDTLNTVNDYDNKSIPEVFLTRLVDNDIKKLPVFIKSSILKSKAFVHKNFYSRSNLVCGDSYIEIGSPSDFSLSQFAFKTIEQYNAWSKAFNRIKNSMKQNRSFEIFFIDKTGIVDYDRMIRECSELIDNGEMRPIETLSKRYLTNKKPSLHYITKKKASEIRNALIFTKDDSDNDNDEIGFNLEEK